MADQARRRRQRILANADVRLRKLKGIRTEEEIVQQQPAAVLVDTDAKSKLLNDKNKHTNHLAVGDVPSQPDPPNAQDVLEESAAKIHGEGVELLSNVDTEVTDEVVAASMHVAADTTSSSNTVAEQHAEKLEQMRKQKQRQHVQGKASRTSRVWLLVAVATVTFMALAHVHKGLSASHCFIFLIVMSVSQSVLQRPRSTLQFVLSVLSQMLTSVSLFMFTLVAYHVMQQYIMSQS